MDLCIFIIMFCLWAEYRHEKRVHDARLALLDRANIQVIELAHLLQKCKVSSTHYERSARECAGVRMRLLEEVADLKKRQ